MVRIIKQTYRGSSNLKGHQHHLRALEMMPSQVPSSPGLSELDWQLEAQPCPGYSWLEAC